jgi:hypothetical protein
MCTLQMDRVSVQMAMGLLHMWGDMPITGVNHVPVWKDDVDRARHKRTLEAVGCRPWFGAEWLWPFQTHLLVENWPGEREEADR